MGFGRMDLQARLNAWLLRVGKWRVVAAITTLCVVASVLMTWFANAVFMPHVPVEEWLYISVVAPLIIAPPISAAVLSLLYQLAEARAALVTMSETDPLTGVGNRRYFLERARLALAESAANGKSASIILLDIDKFKRLNDSYGHALGDEAIMVVANVCRQSLRAGDVFCRWGGEEFIVLLPAAGLRAACGLAERLRASVAATAIKGVPEGVTISLGVAELRSGTETLDQMIANADRQLYLAKDLGRNRVEPMDPAWALEGSNARIRSPED